MCNIQVMNYNTHVMRVINKNPNLNEKLSMICVLCILNLNSPEI